MEKWFFINWQSIFVPSISVLELMSKLPQQGVEFLADVKFAYIEADARISIITSNSKTSSVPEQKTALKSDLH
ncbi:YetF domain-containing protein [Nostoc sp.]|uniref:YetF domain-containing protein n=1 Tax=Nostoc sp. TaxID=1180 RepID=UPI003FA5B67E